MKNNWIKTTTIILSESNPQTFNMPYIVYDPHRQMSHTTAVPTSSAKHCSIYQLFVWVLRPVNLLFWFTDKGCVKDQIAGKDSDYKIISR